MKKGDIKYDGKKKVVVVEPSGDGNGAIVQEIHTNQEKEFPAGPTFFSSKLKAERPEYLTWEGREIKREEANHARLKETMKIQSRDMEIVVAGNKEHLKQLKLVKKSDKKSFERLLDYIAGDILFLAIPDEYKVEKFSDSIRRVDSWSYKHFDSLRLLSLLGASDGRMSWRLNNYSDNSGGSGKTVIPCKTRKEAEKCVQDHIDARIKEGRQVSTDKVLSNGFTIPSEYIRKQIKDHQKNHSEYNKRQFESIDTGNEKHQAKIKYLKNCLKRKGSI